MFFLVVNRSIKVLFFIFMLLFAELALAVNCKEKAMVSFYSALRDEEKDIAETISDDQIEWMKGRGVKFDQQEKEDLIVITLSKNNSLFHSLVLCPHVLIRPDGMPEKDPLEEGSWIVKTRRGKALMPSYVFNVDPQHKNKKQSVFRWLKPAGSFRGNSLIVFDSYSRMMNVDDRWY